MIPKYDCIPSTDGEIFGMNRLSLHSQEGINMKDEIMSCLQSLECPFTWRVEPCNEFWFLSQVEENLLRRDGEDELLKPWKKFVFCLILCYEYTKKCIFDEAQLQAEECERILRTSEETFPKPVYVMGRGLEHVLKGCLCFLYVNMHAYSEARSKLLEITPFNKLETKQQASVWSFRAAFSMEYGYYGVKESICFIEKALDMDKSCALWHFLLGKALGSIRRTEKPTCIPEKKELQALEMAVKVAECSYFVAFLAQAYRETSRSVFFEKQDDYKTFKPFCDSLNKKAEEHYRRALKNGQNSADVNVLCALGFMRLPQPWQDLEMAKLCLEKCLKLAPNNLLVIYSAGSYYKIINDLEKAKQYLARAGENGSYGACMDLTAIKLRENDNYSPVPDLERILSRFTEKPFKHETLCQIGSYYYFCKKDFTSALQYWMRIIEEDIDSQKLKAHRPSFQSPSRVCDLRTIIVKDMCKIRFSTFEEQKKMDNIRTILLEKIS